MATTLELEGKNLSRLAVLNGYDGVSGLAEAVGKNKKYLYNALRKPEDSGPTVAALEKALPKRTVRATSPSPKRAKRKVEVVA